MDGVDYDEVQPSFKGYEVQSSSKDDYLEKQLLRLEVQAFILVGLCLQIILIIFGFRRKYIVRSWIKLLVWAAYLGANWMATVALGNLGKYQENGEVDCRVFSSQTICDEVKYIVEGNQKLNILWSPFLLLHLAGPDTISAYSFEDNELWSRTFFAFIANVGGVFYLFTMTLSSMVTFREYISVPIFISGIIKYGERVYVLWSSSTERFKESLLSNPDPFPDLVKITKQDIDKKLEQEEIDMEREAVKDESHQIFEAFFLFKSFANLFAGLILHDNELLISNKIFSGKLAEDAFNLVAIELGIMYDVLYTKAIIAYSRLGIFLRCISFFCSSFSLILFPLYIQIGDFFLVDTFITFALLAVAFLLEVLAVIELYSTDWGTVIRSTKKKKAQPISIFGNRKRWSKVMGQFNLLSCCFKDESAKYTKVQNFFFIGKRLMIHLNLSWEDVGVDLQKMIFKELSEKIDKYKLHDDHFCDTHLLEKILHQRGDYVLQERYELEEFDCFTNEVELDHSLLLWHIATDLCYYEDFDKHEGTDNNSLQTRKFGKCLSDYMLYLLVVCPYMMPKGNGELRFRKTCVMVRRFIELSKSSSTSIKRVEDCKLLLQNNIFDHLKSDDMSVLVEGCNLAKKLQLLESKDGWNQERKWKMITEVWVEILMYAANECDWKDHGYQLRKGGELLTHVRLLMTHLGLSVQYNKNGRKLD